MPLLHCFSLLLTMAAERKRPPLLRFLRQSIVFSLLFTMAAVWSAPFG
jgi:hypothetical protein